MTRIEAAMKRIASARANAPESSTATAAAPKLMELVNSHEKLREEVAETMRELDELIAELDQ
ncbi:hypothetical protein [Erythrobacter sp. THAF29]|uniref:hypothetical protein n=1 Tax=Erythrobacter sp. THAF29 TaxID=2587851 RepID=UPI001267D0BC|nr:hypothetical protein [Erythrobacter sp. THAF29]